MSVPYIFESGDVASSAEVNENFTHHDDILGHTSTADAMALPGTVVLGPRSNVQISAEPDAEYGEDSYVQIGWNAELYNSSGEWLQRRFTAGEAASALRIGKDGLGFYGTSNTSGSLNSRLTKLFGVTPSSQGDRVFINSDVHIQRHDTPVDTLSDYRLTYVPFGNPVAIYEAANIFRGTKQRTATVHSAAANAIAVELVAYIKAGSQAGSLQLMQAEGNPSIGTGFVVHANANGWASGSGIVHLGVSGSYAGKFIEERSANFNDASLFVKGYWI